MPNRNAASVGNKCPELKSRDLDVDVVTVTEAWLQPGEGIMALWCEIAHTLEKIGRMQE